MCITIMQNIISLLFILLNPALRLLSGQRKKTQSKLYNNAQHFY